MIVAQFQLTPLPISLTCVFKNGKVEELCIAQRSQMQAIGCDREIMSWKLRALLSPHGRPCTFILLSCCCLQPSQLPSCLLWAWANAFSWIPLTAKYPQVNLKHLGHFLKKHFGTRVGGKVKWNIWIWFPIFNFSSPWFWCVLLNTATPLTNTHIYHKHIRQMHLKRLKVILSTCRPCISKFGIWTTCQNVNNAL